MSDERTATRSDSPASPAGRFTHFGNREVPLSAKSGLVRGVFESVAGRYDLMNDLMSGGVHRLWKAALVDWVAPRPGQHILDVAGGTGDIAFRLLERARGKAEVTVLDLTPEMLAVGRDRAVDHGHLRGLRWVCGDAQMLPLPARSMDAYTIAFGLRNVTDIDLALAEAYRVLRPGGRVFCLEFSRVMVPMLAELYDLYSYRVVPTLGQLVARDRDSYQYLVDSIRRFPSQDELAERFRAAGFGQVRYRNYTGGIAAIHAGWRL
jgi:demethylmenaquinone methyltransferase/2-methoxy-6-polyprenyl-1,4-benzoquinol methylase